MVAINARSNDHAHNAVRRRARLDPLLTTEQSFHFEFDCRTTTRYRMPGTKDPDIYRGRTRGSDKDLLLTFMRGLTRALFRSATTRYRSCRIYTHLIIATPASQAAAARSSERRSRSMIGGLHARTICACRPPAGAREGRRSSPAHTSVALACGK
jgi:hypothetical protein